MAAAMNARFHSTDDIRRAWGPDWADASDAELIAAYAASAKIDPVQVANRFGYGNDSPDSKWSNRWGASADNYQAGLYGVGEAVTDVIGLGGVSDFLRRGRERNETDAYIARARAAEQGAISSYKDVGSFGDAMDYVGGLGVDSAPYLVEAAAGGLIARGAMTGTRAAVSAAREMGMEQAAASGTKALGRASLAGGAAASYPSAVGDILQSQRDQAGTTDLGMAALGGVPYAALNAVGVEGAVARGGLFRNTMRSLDDAQGVRGVAARTGATVARTGAVEGASETGQEMINQSFGRMAVDPNEAFFSDAAMGRYGESFVGGAALGGAMGGAMGGWRRSEGYRKPVDVEAPNADLLGAGRPDFDMQGQAPFVGPEMPMQPDGLVDRQNPNQIEMFDPTRAPTYNADTSFSPIPGERALRTGSPQGTMLGQPDTTPPAGPLDVSGMAPGEAQAFYEYVAQKADAGAPLSPAEEQFLNAYSTGTTNTNPAPLILPDRQGAAQGELFQSERPGVGFDGLPMPPRGPAPEAELSGTQTDMFDARPTATVQTDFDSGRLVRELRQGHPKQQANGYVTKLAADLSKVIDDPKATEALLLDRQERLYASKALPATTDWQQKVLDRAVEAAERHQSRMTDAQVQEAAQRAQPGVTVGARPSTEGSAPIARDRNEVSQREDTLRGKIEAAHEQQGQRREAEAQQAAVRETQERRMRLERILGDNLTRNPVTRFTAELRKAGLDPTATAEEMAYIDRFGEAKGALKGKTPEQGELNLGDNAPATALLPAAEQPAAEEKRGRGMPKKQLSLLGKEGAVQAAAPAVETQATAPAPTDATQATPEQSASQKYESLLACLKG